MSDLSSGVTPRDDDERCCRRRTGLAEFGGADITLETFEGREPTEDTRFIAWMAGAVPIVVVDAANPEGRLGTSELDAWRRVVECAVSEFDTTDAEATDSTSLLDEVLLTI